MFLTIPGWTSARVSSDVTHVVLFEIFPGILSGIFFGFPDSRFSISGSIFRTIFYSERISEYRNSLNIFGMSCRRNLRRNRTLLEAQGEFELKKTLAETRKFRRRKGKLLLVFFLKKMDRERNPGFFSRKSFHGFLCITT